MKTVVRVMAEHAGDPDDEQDARWKLIFVGVIDNSILVPQFCFGFAIEVDDGIEERWPFIVEPPINGRSAVLDSGPGGDPAKEPINIYERNIVEGTLFTRGANDDAATYRIVGVEPFI